MKSVSEFWKRFAQPCNSHAATTVAQHFEEDANFHFLDGREFQGLETITKFYADAFSQMPSTWIHCGVSIEEEKRLNASGALRIKDANKGTSIVVAPYTLKLSSDGRIRRLGLRNHELQP